MKKISLIALLVALSVGIGVINWLTIIFCINCTGKVPVMLFGY